jgi:acetyl-CoA carboxylase biotin carboxylase subunit
VKKGHAIECRINAENAYTVRALAGAHHAVPRGGRPRHPLRLHVYANYYVPPHYDSLIGKLIAYGDTREQAIARMRVALPRW